MTIALVLATVVCNILSQTLLKGAMARHSDPVSRLPWSKMTLDPVLVGGVLFAALTLVAYILTLRRLDLSVAYPVVTGLGFLGVFVVSWRLFGESITTGRVLGALLIVGGIALLSWHANAR